MLLSSSTRTEAINIEDVTVGDLIVVPNGIAKPVTKVSFSGAYAVLDLKDGSTKYGKRGQVVRKVA